MRQQTDRATEFHDASRIVRFVRFTKGEAEPDLLLYLCLPAVLIGTLLKVYYMYYVAVYVACASFLSSRYGELNYQQYSSMGMMLVMACTMQFIQPVRPVKSPPAGSPHPPGAPTAASG
ncbi:hypothetical protein Efla_003211 [Eimeria flavescens]